MITIFVHRNGQTEQVDRASTAPGSIPAAASSSGSTSRRRRCPKLLILSDTFAFHPLSVEDAMRRAAATRRSRPTTATSTSSCTASTSEPSAARLRDARRRLLPRARTIWSPSTTASRDRSRSCASTVRERQDPRRGPGRAVPPHRRRDGRPLPARGGEARGAARRARERGLRATAANDWSREILDEKRDVAVAAAHHHAAARRHRPPGAARVRRHQHRDVVPVPRRLRPPRPHGRRGA